jgi:hypothetical protein
LANALAHIEANISAVLDRAFLIRFEPSVHEVHLEVGKWFKDQEVFKYIGKRLSLIPEASMRWYVKAGEMHRLGADWKSWLLRAWLPEDPKLAMVAEILNDPKLQTADQRAKRFGELGGGSRATFMRKQAEWRRLRGLNGR